MNNIYKVIWSKAKNCYVVVSEIARSHTKSASGSEKIGEVARHALLALGAACAIACGGFVNVGAVEYEHVDVQTTGTSTATVYTKNGTESYVDHALTHFDTKTQVDDKIKALKTGDVATNKDNITALQTTTTDHGQKITANTTQIANNTAAIAKKIDTETAEAKLALKANAADVYTKADVNTELVKKADVTALDGKADKSYVDTAVAGAVTTAGTNVDAKLAAYATTAEVDGKIADEVNARNNAITTTIEQERHDRDAAIDNAINGEVTERNQAIHDAIELEKTNRDAAITNAKLELQGKITGEETERKEADTAFNNRLTTAEGKIGANETAIGELKAKDTALEGKINAEKTEREAKDNAILGRIGKVADDGNYIKNSNTNSVSKNLKALDAQAKINADAIVAETAARTNKDTELEGKINTLGGNVTTAQGDINDLKAKDIELEGRIHTNEGNIETNKNAIAAIDKRTAGIGRDDATSETTIENNVKVNSIGDVTAKGQLTAYGGVNTGTGDITTKGDVNAGSLNVENASHLKGDVTMDNNLTVKGDTSLKGTKVDGKLTVTDDADLKNTKVDGTLTTTGKATFKEAVEMDKGLTVTNGDTTLQKTNVNGALNVTGASDLKGDVTLGTPNGANTVTVNGTANFHEVVNMGNGLNVTNGDTKLKATTVEGKLTAGDAELKNTKVGGTLGVTGETTLDDKLTVKGEATFKEKVTMEKDLEVKGELKTDKISMKNTDTDTDGTIHNSSTTITADGITHNGEVKKSGVTTESQFTHTEEGSETYAKKGNTTNWTETRSDVKADGVKTEANDSKGNRTNTSQAADGIKGYATDKDGNKTYTKVTATENSFQVQDKNGDNKNHQVNTMGSSVTEITNAAGATTKTEQTAENITNIAQSGTITNDAQNIVNNASENITNTAQNGTIKNDAQNIVNNASENITTTANTMNTTVNGQATESYGGLNTTVNGAENHTVNGKQINTVGDGQINNITGNQTTTVTGDISNTAKNITNEANTKLTDKVGENTRVLDSEGITDTVGGSTFKQRIDKIMMESKDVSIKAEETLTNEAKVITNKASEVINNEAVNINNTATGIITSKASEIKNQADKLISNKVGENTWENMENGKITTSIKDGAKQNLTQSDAAGTTQSTVDGGKSTVTIQNADGLADAVTDGTNTSVQNQTASAIAAAVKDGAGNENASVANATTSANTIKSGSKVNTVISTADGTSFINSEAAAPVGDGTEVKTTIKGNTITTGKVTMDYAEVMKDLGVRGNANITGKTTTGSLEVTRTSTLKGNVTMESNATVKKDLTVEGNTNLKNTKVDGTLDVTQKATFGDSVSIAKDLSVDGNATIKGDVTAKSYKVGDKTYISAAGINANDQKITNVADGSISEGSKDAVNGGQLYTVKNDLEGKVNKVGANAAAMANLHPMEFDPDSKWNIAAAIGNYGSETAAALGAFYRPNDDVMVNLSTAFGTGENMVGGGVSVRLGKSGNKLSREENNALKDQVNDLTARMDALLSVLNPNMSKDFPDVPENHWAYEAVSRLAGNDIVQGYPDGEFHGERTMTRYEMAEIIYNALSRGAEAEKELVEEFKPELQAMAASEKATAERAEG